MADHRNACANPVGSNTFKEAACIDANRIYDSCSDKDCLEDLQVYFTDRTQPIIDSAISIKARDVEIINVFLDVEPIQFNRGFYSVDITFFFKVRLSVYCSPLAPATHVNGVCTFSKKVILFGSEGNVKVFSSDSDRISCREANSLPIAKLQCVDPVVLDARLVECGCGHGHNRDSVALPRVIEGIFEGDFSCVAPVKEVTVTLGLFTIVSLLREVQMMVPCYDYAVPDKECVSSTDEPCELFRRIKFPVDEFFPPNISGCSN